MWGQQRCIPVAQGHGCRQACKNTGLEETDSDLTPNYCFYFRAAEALVMLPPPPRPSRLVIRPGDSCSEPTRQRAEVAPSAREVSLVSL